MQITCLYRADRIDPVPQQGQDSCCLAATDWLVDFVTWMLSPCLSSQPLSTIYYDYESKHHNHLFFKQPAVTKHITYNTHYMHVYQCSHSILNISQRFLITGRLPVTLVKLNLWTEPKLMANCSFILKIWEWCIFPHPTQMSAIYQLFSVIVGLTAGCLCWPPILSLQCKYT